MVVLSPYILGEHHMQPTPTASIAGSDDAPIPPSVDVDYWHALIDEKVAAEFLGLTGRTMQKLRQRGDGPRYVRISSRCLRYRRCDLRAYAEARMQFSTADEAAA